MTKDSVFDKTKAVLETINKYDNRKTIRYALDGMLKDQTVTDVKTLKDRLDKLGVVLNTDDSSNWTLSNKSNGITPLNISDLSKKYTYTVSNIKSALTDNNLSDIPLTKSDK